MGGDKGSSLSPVGLARFERLNPAKVAAWAERGNFCYCYVSLSLGYLHKVTLTMIKTFAAVTVCMAMATGETIASAVPLPLPPLLAQGVGALVQPGGIEGLAQKPPEDGGEPAAADAGEAKPETAPAASPFELRYIFSYVLMLAFVGGSTFLIIRPSGRKIQGDDGAATGKGPAKAKK